MTVPPTADRAACPPRPFERLVERGGLAFDLLAGSTGAFSGALVIAFASIGHDPARAPSPELVGTATAGGRSALFVTDARRSWGQTADFAEGVQRAVALVRQRQEIRQILTLGSSMGGHMALRAASFLPVDVAMAFGPQSMLDPASPRWQPWAAHAAPISPPPPTAGWTLLFHGMQDDLDQALGFPPAPGVDHVLFADQSHSGLMPHLKARGALAGLVEAALAGDRRRLLRIAASAGGRLRHRMADQLPR
ncbi:hypothetical protein [Pseudogemmobacter blasticus]|uniref:Alpha/beta hydrolase n=1 Tax=Fuscovulum blasticum DSM 2131 TaxID=1188250 RepID=A0A2T4J7U6_FUSBL|nr:hypothetical protein [Fuscovulum blasticum]PTE13990.1 hypothetical protein C5F44_11790 [Fuscovulum blasticum DSM 2131]